jgi:hypothetical protein
LVTAAGGAGHLSAHCADAPAPSAPDAATRHAEKPSSGQLGGGQGVTKASTTGAKKTAARAAQSKPDAIAIRRSGAGTGGKASAPTNAPATTTPRHGPKAPGTSRLPAGSSGRPPVSAGAQVPRGTRRSTTSTARSHRHRPGTKPGKRAPPASKTSTHGKPGTTSPVKGSPVSSSTPAGRGPSEHDGKPGGLRRPRECTDSARPGQVVRSHHDCHPVTPTGSNSIATSARSGRHDARPPTSGPSVGSKTRSVKHRKGM